MRLKSAILNKLFSQKQTDLRNYPRFPLVHDRIGLVFLAGKLLGRVREISYGGISVEPLGTDFPTLPKESIQAIRLQLLDDALVCHVVTKSVGERSIGFAFQHESLRTYEFLRQFLPFMKFGAALRYLIRNDEQNSKKLPPLLHQDEDIRVSLDIEAYDEDQIPLGSIEIAEGGLFFKLVRNKEQVRTYHSVGIGGVAGPLRETEKLDPDILRKTLCFLIGYASAEYQIPVGKLIQFLMTLPETRERFPQTISPKSSAALVFPLESPSRTSRTLSKRNSRRR